MLICNGSNFGPILLATDRCVLNEVSNDVSSAEGVGIRGSVGQIQKGSQPSSLSIYGQPGAAVSTNLEISTLKIIMVILLV